MTSVKPSVVEHVEPSVPGPAEARVMIPEPEDFGAVDMYKFSALQAAEQLGIHRVTLKRMHDRGLIPPAKWRRLPAPHRVYSHDDIELIRGTMVTIADAKGDNEREYVE